MEETRVSKFNSTLAILFRIDDLWKLAHRYAISGRLMMWNWVLDRVWCELGAEAKPEEDKEFIKLNTNIKPTKNFKDKDELYKTLLKKEIFLRKLQNKQGKGVAYEESVEDYMD